MRTLILALVAVLGCGPVVPRPIAPPALCAHEGNPHELLLPDGAVAVCPDDPAGYSTDPISDFARRRVDAGAPCLPAGCHVVVSATLGPLHEGDGGAWVGSATDTSHVECADAGVPDAR